MKVGSLMVLFIAMLVAMPLCAKEKVEPAVNANTKDSFDTVSTWVRKEMAPGGRYSYVTAAESTTINAKFEEMSRLYAKTPDIAQMAEADKTQMFNDQEQINSILGKRDNDRLICKNEIPVGSHIPVKTCETAGAIEARRRNDNDYLQRRQATMQLKTGH